MVLGKREGQLNSLDSSTLKSLSVTLDHSCIAAKYTPVTIIES